MKIFLAVLLILVIGFSLGSFSSTSNLLSFLNKDAVKIEKLNEQAKDAWQEMTDIAKKESGVVFDMQYLDAMITMYEASTKLSSLGSNIGTNDVKDIAKSIADEDTAKLNELKKLKAELEKQLEAESKEKQKPPFIKE